VATGAVGVGDTLNEDCTSAQEGLIRWTGSALEFCDGGGEWFTFRLTGGTDGTDAGSPGLSCAGIKTEYPSSTDGTYWIDPDGDTDPTNSRNVYCDMTGGGWTLMAVNHQDAHSSDFDQDWNTYKNGFGNILSPTAPAGWLGNEYIHHLTKDGSTQLKVTTNTRTYTYNGWNIENEANNYRVHVPQSSANGGNADIGFHYQDGMEFTTKDRDNDPWTGGSQNCAINTSSGWWYRTCWYTHYAAASTSQSYWNEQDYASDNYTTIDLWLK